MARYSIRKGRWEQQMIDTVKQSRCDLVLIGHDEDRRPDRNMQVDPDRIAAETDIPVISMPYERRLTHIYSILIPVTHFLPIRKLMYGAYIASKNQASLKLLGVETAHSKERTRYFLKKSYELIHESSSVYVGLALTETENVAAAVGMLAREEATDLVLVNPGEETRLPGSLLSPQHKTLSKASSSPVLIINPL